MPEIIGVFFFLSTLAAKVGIGESFDLVELAPHGMFAVVMVLLLRYIPARDAAHREQLKLIIEQMKLVIEQMKTVKEKEISRLMELLKKS